MAATEITTRTTVLLCVAFVCLGSSAQAAPRAKIGTVKTFAEKTPRAYDHGAQTLPPLTVPLPQTTAGSHANYAFEVNTCQFSALDASVPACGPGETGGPRVFVNHLPTGMFGNPNGAFPCPADVWYGIPANLGPECIAYNSRIGVSGGKPVGGPPAAAVTLFNVETVGSQPARVGTAGLPGLGRPESADISIRSDSDYGIDSYLDPLPIPPGGHLIRINNVLCAQANCPTNYDQSRPYWMTNPTTCTPAKFGVDIASYEEPELFSSGSHSFTPTDCATLTSNYDPHVSVAPDSTQAGLGTGYKVTIDVPEHISTAVAGGKAANGSPRISPHLYQVETKLPQGVKFSPNVAKKLEGCTKEQFGVTSDAPFRADKKPIRCPENSKVGTVDITVPILDGDTSTPTVDPATGMTISGNLDPIKGYAYFAQPDKPGAPTKDDPWHLWLGIEDSGVRVKLQGDVTVDPQTGQITTRFTDSPQTPFTKLELKLNGGEDSVLQNPTSCGDNTSSFVFRPWSMSDASSFGTSPLDPFALQSSFVKEAYDLLFTRTSDFTTTGCQQPTPFSPTVSGSTDPTQAGSFTRSRLFVTRQDGEQTLRNLSLSLPPGLVGSLRGIDRCSIAQLDAAACPAGSTVGSVTAAVGTGAAPLQTSGSLFLADPYLPGDVATIGAVIPAKVGPIDLGKNVIIKNRVIVRRGDVGLDVISTDLPEQIDGVPLPVKAVTIDVNRKNFIRNGTSCADKALGAVFSSHQGAQSQATFADHPTGCGALPFRPTLSLSAGVPGEGQTGLRKHATFKAVVTQTPGEANISSARVVLPNAVRPDTVNINKPGALCLKADFEANTCPPTSIVGEAEASTPLLDSGLRGPVYIVQRATGALPDLSVQLRGAVGIDLLARNELRVPDTINTFDALPDVPQSSFELTIHGGNRGLLLNFYELCQNAPAASKRGDATFVAHSGAVYQSKPELNISGCESLDARAILSKAKLSKNGKKLKVKVACPGTVDCSGRVSASAKKKVRRKARRKRVRAGRTRKINFGSTGFAMPAGQSETVTIRVRRSARRALKRSRRLTVRIVAKTTSGKSSRKTLKVRRRR